MTPDHPAPARALGAEYAERLRRSYLNFRWPLFLLEPDEQTLPCLENGWTPIAAAAHVAYWDSYQLRRMQAALDSQGILPVPVSVETNDERAASENRSWETVLEEADAARQELITFALSLADEQIEAEYVYRGERSPIVKLLLEHMPKHVAEHAVDVHRYCFSIDRWGRERLLGFYRRHFNSLLDAITGLTEERLQSPYPSAATGPYATSSPTFLHGTSMSWSLSSAGPTSLCPRAAPRKWKAVGPTICRIGPAAMLIRSTPGCMGHAPNCR